MARPYIRSLEERLTFYVDRRSPDECWPWTGAKQSQGYGSVFVSPGVRKYAHRVAFEQVHGPIPDGYDVDHVCHNRDSTCDGGKGCPHRLCCNPAHLEAVPRATNLRRGKGSTFQQKCPRGHERTPENTYISPAGRRMCRPCCQIREQVRPPRKRK